MDIIKGLLGFLNDTLGISNILSFLTSCIGSIAIKLFSFLPVSPIYDLMQQIKRFDFLGWLNWFLPFSFCLTCLNAWLICVGVYYAFPYLKKLFSATKLL